MKNKNIKEILFYYIVIFIMVMTLNLAIRDCTGMELSLVRMVLFTFAATLGMSIILLFPVSLLAILLPGIGLLAYNYYADPEFTMGYLQEIPEFLSWLHGYIAGFNYFRPDYSSVFAIIYTIFTTLVISLIVYSGKGSFVLIVIGTAAMSFFWFIYVEKARLYLVLFLFAGIMLYSNQIYRKRLREWKAAESGIEYNVGNNWMLCSAGVIIISLLLSLAVPLNIEPVRWPWLNDKVVSLFPFIAEWRNDSLESFSYGYNSRFSLNSAGYIGKKLGGELRQDASVLMTVNVPGEETLYLRGAVRDKYFDNSWSKSRRGFREYEPGEAIPSPYGEDIDTFKKSMDITYKKLITSTVFGPYSIHRVQHDSRRIYIDEDTEVYTSKMTMKGNTYTVESIIPYMDEDKLRQAGAMRLGYNELKLYTSLAQDISERVRQMAQQITEGQNSNYDKAKAVESYLRRNYQYTLKPPELPEKSEFTDHFLFEGRKGYCTYFATSMAVLLRAAGVPCRYVEGFIARYDGARIREVRGVDSHAWVEVYFDDFGWVAFEPTPQYPAIEYRISGHSEEEESKTETEITPGNLYIPDKIDRRLAMEEELGEGMETEYTGLGERNFNAGKVILLLLFSLLLLRIGFMHFKSMLVEMRLGRKTGQSYAVEYIKDIIRYFRRGGIEMEQDETLRAFMKKVYHYYKEDFSDITEVTAILEKTRYGSHNPGAEERKALEAFRKKARQLAVREAGVVKFFISFYILGR